MLDHAEAPPSSVPEILEGLAARQKTLPAKLFYDVEGCRLFGMITDLDEYYLTRTENALLRASAAALSAETPPGSVLVEYGASDEGKAAMLLESGRFSHYVPIDIAPEALRAIVRRLSGARPRLRVLPVTADFMRPLGLPAETVGRPVLGFFPGSTIGNLHPAEAVAFMARVRDTLLAGTGEAVFVVGADLRKDPAIMVRAYDDARGVTAAFNRNMLAHVNRVADADFALDRFRHVALWNAAESRIEMHLESMAAQEVQVAGTLVRFRPGETIHTENSYKHTAAALAGLASAAGWTAAGFRTDPDGMFGIHVFLARRG